MSGSVASRLLPAHATRRRSMPRLPRCPHYPGALATLLHCAGPGRRIPPPGLVSSSAGATNDGAALHWLHAALPGPLSPDPTPPTPAASYPAALALPPCPLPKTPPLLCFSSQASTREQCTQESRRPRRWAPCCAKRGGADEPRPAGAQRRVNTTARLPGRGAPILSAIPYCYARILFHTSSHPFFSAWKRALSFYTLTHARVAATHRLSGVGHLLGADRTVCSAAI